MRTNIDHIPTRVYSRIRVVLSGWWGGISCRVAFLMSLAILLVLCLAGAFLLWQGKRNREVELRNRVHFIASYFSSLAVDDIIKEDRKQLSRKLSPAFLSSGTVAGDLAYVIVYNREGRLLIANTSPESVQSRQRGAFSLGVLDRSTVKGPDPLFDRPEENLYEVVKPVVFNNATVGYVRIGIVSGRTKEEFDGVSRRAVVVVIPILLIGMLFSKTIAAGIVRPIARLGSAIDELSRQNWQSPIPVKGRDEISRLAEAFNQMALTLKQREVSLSQGNRDLFILHTTGLDLMETLEVRELLGKIAARAEDLIRVDTVSVAAVDPATFMLRYLGVEGGLARQLSERKLPFEAGGIFNWLTSHGTPLLIRDAHRDFRLDGEEMKTLGIDSVISVPLWSSNTMIGILTAANKKGGDLFDKHDLRLFTVFSSIAGAALQNAFLYSDLKNKMDELRSTQQQLVHSTKLAAIGKLAANIAHEINNPLTSVLGYTSHLLRTLDVPEVSRQKLRLMEQETLRVRKIIRNLLDFSRQRTPWKQPGDLLQPLKETVALLRGLAERSSVRIEEVYPDTPTIINMDHNEMKQVFINIMNNALHAMSQGGSLRICVVPVHEREIMVEFQDSGHGIPEEHLGKIFEPFFSTKEYGDGTGLGLSISERIVQGHGGRIDVESVVGRGTVVRLLLPAAEQHLVHQQT